MKHYVTSQEQKKVWLCLYTCCVTRGVYIDLVPDLNTVTFIRSFKRFSARRGIPAKVISDNGRTFKSASKAIQKVLEAPEVKRHFTDVHCEWSFNLEKAPWWGGMFERLIKSAKRCLKKTIGRAHLTYDELLTLVTEVEAVLNLRPLTYVAMDDLESPLTPSHLLLGYRVLSLPDPSLSDDPSYSESTVEGLTRRMRHLIKTSEKFWKRWKKEYLLELRESHRTHRTDKGVVSPVRVGEIVTIHEEGRPRGLWRLGKIEYVMRGSDGEIRGACVRVLSKTGRFTLLRRPIQHLYPLEVCSQEAELASMIRQDATPPTPSDSQTEVGEDRTPDGHEQRPRRHAAIHARDRIFGCVTD